MSTSKSGTFKVAGEINIDCTVIIDSIQFIDMDTAEIKFTTRANSWKGWGVTDHALYVRPGSDNLTITTAPTLADQYYNNNPKYCCYPGYSETYGYRIKRAYTNSSSSGHSLAFTANVTGIAAGTVQPKITLIFCSIYGKSGTSKELKKTGGDLTVEIVTPKLDAVRYDVTYNKNKCEGIAPEAMYKIHGIDLILSGSGNLSSPEKSLVSITASFKDGSNIVADDISVKQEVSYSLNKWNSKADGTGEWYDFSGIYSNNDSVELFAQLTSTSSPVTITLPSEAKYNVPEGYKLTDWKNGNNTFKLGSSTKISSNTVFEPIWSLKEYTIILNANGGSCNPSKIVVKHGFTYGTLPEPSRPGFKFLGWYTASAGGDKVLNSTTVTKEHNLYAHWEAYQLIIKYYSNGATLCSGKNLNGEDVNVYNQIIRYDEKLNDGLVAYKASDSTLAMSREGYEPTGDWGSAPSGGLLISENITNQTGASIAERFGKDLSNTNAELKLYAQWKKLEYKINYIVYDKAYSPEDVILTIDNSKLLTIDDLKKRFSDLKILDCHTFKYWITLDGKLAQGFINESLKNSSSTKVYNIYAKFDENFKIVYKNKDGEFNRLSPIQYKNGEWIKLTPYIKV